MPRPPKKPKRPPDYKADNSPNFTTSRLRRFINELPAGKIFTTADCMQYGPRTSVDQALCRLAKAKRIRRVAYGVFIRNDDNAVLPALAEIAEAKARAFGKKIYEHGRDLAHKLKLVDSVNPKPVFLIHGASTSFQSIHERVYLKGTTPRKTRNRDSKAGRLLAALWQLGYDHVDAQTVQRGTREFFREDFQQIHEMGGLVPAWLAPLVSRTWKWGPPRMVST